MYQQIILQELIYILKNILVVMYESEINIRIHLIDLLTNFILYIFILDTKYDIQPLIVSGMKQ